MGNRKKEQDNYTLYQKRIYNENRILIHYASFLSVTVNTLAFLLSFFSEIMRSSRLIYALGAILSVVCVLLFRFFEEKQAGTSAGWFYGFWSGILLETAVLGTLMQPHGNTVTFCVTLITLGALLLDRPGRIFILMASASILCCLFSFLSKELSLALMDLINITISLIIGIFVASYTSASRINDLLAKGRILKQRDKDPLTNLRNRKAAQKYITDYLEKNSDLCAMLIMDIDHFKTVNDVFGHMYGDKIIRETGTKLNQIFRSSDCICRLGGDEFMIFMTKLPDKDIVLKKAAQLNKSIFTCLNKDHRKYMISASIGICFTDSGKSTYSQLYKNADSALYSSKQNGRNQYSVYRNELKDTSIS